MSSTLALLLLLQLSLSFTVFSQDEENLVSWVAMPPHHHSLPPVYPPPPPPHHHHHHHRHPPAPSPLPTPPPPHTPSTPPPAHPPGHHHHHHHPPPPPPAVSPAHPSPPPKPSHPPSAPPPSSPPPKPSHPPMAPPPKPYPPKPHPSFKRLLVAVEGVVFLKSCKYAGKDTLYLASPLPGATVQLQCNSTVKPIKAQAQTDKNGYFLILGPKTLTNYAAHKCKVSLLPSKLPAAKIPSDLHGGLTGATLNVDKKKPLVVVNKVEYALFHVGPFAFEPKCPK